jgi:hypothetical protein
LNLFGLKIRVRFEDFQEDNVITNKYDATITGQTLAKKEDIIDDLRL